MNNSIDPDVFYSKRAVQQHRQKREHAECNAKKGRVMSEEERLCDMICKQKCGLLADTEHQQCRNDGRACVDVLMVKAVVATINREADRAATARAVAVVEQAIAQQHEWAYDEKQAGDDETAFVHAAQALEAAAAEIAKGADDDTDRQ